MRRLVWKGGLAISTFGSLLGLAILSGPAGAAEATASSATVLACGKIFDGKAETLFGPAEILVADGKITQIGPKVDRPPGAAVIDLADRTVLPGFIDLHVHVMGQASDSYYAFIERSQARKAFLGAKNLKTLLLNGFTTVRSVGEFDSGFASVELRRAIEEGIVDGSRFFVAPHMVSATGGHGDLEAGFAPEFGIQFMARADGPSRIREVIRLEHRGGADWIKVAATGGIMSRGDSPDTATYTQEELNILVQTAKELELPVTVHAHGTEGIKRSIRAGVRNVEHFSIVDDEAIRMAEDKGVFATVTWSIWDALLENAPKLPAFAQPKLKKYLPLVLESRQRIAAAKKLKIVYGTDCGAAGYQVADNWKEFPTMVKYGLSPVRALQAATSTAASCLNRPDLGELAAGKTADIIAIKGDPLADISACHNVVFVMKEGKVYKGP
jgi:imidazolonepropionase-like amidohydrolase